MNKDRFGYEWEKYSAIKPQYFDQYQDQFLNWTYPLTKDFYHGKKILDAGCGMGRNSYWCLLWGCLSLVACDHDVRSVASARKTLSAFSNASVHQYDLEKLPWADEFDFIFSIGVIHHTRDPYMVMKQLYRALKPGGDILIWVYSSEGFESILKIMDPVRRHLTSKLPLSVLHFLSYGISLPLYGYLHIFKQRRSYFLQLRSFSFSHLHSIIFDQLLPPIARYYTRYQAQDLLRDFKNVSIETPPNKNGWIVRGQK